MRFPQLASAKKSRRKTINRICEHIQLKIKKTENEEVETELRDLIKEIPKIFKIEKVKLKCLKI